ncbi:MAG: primosomal protein N' [Candidatus Moraniibacteriota bacterium]|nr:MAG: primosomal protein N' [Candidatus Moranbacteria bacterium]
MQKTSTQFLISVAPLTRITLLRDQSFFYTFSRPLAPGTHVEIPIGKRNVQGIVTKNTKDFPRESTFEIKKIKMVIEEKFLTKEQLQLAFFISKKYYCPLGVVLKHFTPQKIGTRREQPVSQKTSLKKIITTNTQESFIEKFLYTDDKKFFFHATRQSEKVSTLFSLAKRNAENSTQTLYLLPEIIQTPYFTTFIHQFFPAEEVAILHSKLSKGMFYKKWCDIRSGNIKIIIGTRSALFAPFTNLGAVIVDDAHDISHKQWEHAPLYDVRRVSEELASLHQCVHILTSVTPRTIDFTYRNINHDRKYIDYINHQKPPIEIVDMKKERWDKNKSPLSRTLVAHIRNCIKNNKQALLFVNRQGMSAFSICSKCRSVATCPQCTRALIAKNKEKHICIHCNAKFSSSKKCQKCNAPMEHVGIGTERIQKELKKQILHARIAVVDTSTMGATHAQKKIYDDFLAGNIDVIIGTQMITKDWQTNSIGLTAIIDADHLLSLPDYTTNERAFSFVIQMALRTSHGKLIVQTFEPENPVLQYAQKYDFNGFHKEESALRKTLKYPPYTTLIKLMHKDTTKKSVEESTEKEYEDLKKILSTKSNVVISEPHFPLVDKVRTKFRKQIIIKIENTTLPQELDFHLKTLDTKWSIDIDPVHII